MESERDEATRQRSEIGSLDPLVAAQPDALFHAVFEESALPMAVVRAADGDADVLDANIRMRELAHALGSGDITDRRSAELSEPLTVSQMLGGIGTPLGHDWNPADRWQQHFIATDTDGAERTLLVMTVPVRAASTPAGVTKANAPDDAPLAIVQIDDVTEQHAARQELAYNAHHDVLTELPNRTLIEQRLEHAQRRSERTKTHLGVLFIDLDSFKDVNDLHGHQVGDRLLIEIAKRFVGAVRLVDTAARLSGDEFLVLCEDLDGDRSVAEAELNEIAQRLHTTLANPVDLDGTQVWVSASVGMHLVQGVAEPSGLVMSNADAAMYRAKALGRSRTESFDARQRRQLVDRLELAKELRFASERDQLHVAYQPIVLLHTGQPVAGEALLRWDLPGVGAIPPTRFIEIAEESSMIVDLGEFVLDDICRRVVTAPPGVDFVTMNVSARQLSDSDFVGRLRTSLDEYQIEPRRIAIELTENVLMDAAGSSIRQLAELRRLGVAIGVDDFGTGYASLTYLRNLPVSFVKVDRAFVSGMNTNKGDRAIVSAVLHLAQALGLLSIAEGVEHREQAAILTEMGCTYAQGFYYGRPQPRSIEFDDLVGAGR